MLGKLFRKTDVSFEIVQPHILITNNMSRNIFELKSKSIEYHEVTNGYIVFCVGVFSSESILCVGLHYNLGRLKFIELFRPKEYYTDNYNIDESFAQLNEQLVSRYGKPSFEIIEPTTDANAKSQVRWDMRGIKIEHWIMDRFGPEEHLQIYLKDK